ncbi:MULTISPECIES: hypothetical protein [Alteribacter]|uniref:Uncharacterized protein n=1 Tax=Alteribacter keqinensis TaxID=2483800 RepID=A0A3M7TY09_9BACI|nr:MULTISPECIES: hypothetical protein [Alteribacter]MBM7096308.1 hypothetical protein [Alteribacter salitolerans]RNA70466.1 hypothetical protein EBO34_11250 [Alteribacter keqinensis]
MINEATLIVALVFLFLLIFASVGYLFFIIIERIRMTKLKTTLYITGLMIVSFLFSVAIYHFIVSPLVDPSNVYIENLRNYSFYYVIGWNAYFAVLTVILLLLAVGHHIYAVKKDKEYFEQKRLREQS